MPAPYTYSVVPLNRTGWVASTNDAAFGAAALAIDGNVSTFWATNGTIPTWLILDMLTPQTFDMVTALPRQDGWNDWPGDVEIYASSNGITWGTAVYTVTGLPGNATQKNLGPFPGGPVTFRWVRYNISAPASGSRVFQGAAEVNVGIRVPVYVVAPNIIAPPVGTGRAAKHQRVKAPSTVAAAPSPTGSGNAGYTG